MTIDFLNGYLKAMEEVNHRTNHGYTFELRKMEDKHDLHASIVDAFTFQGVTDVLGYKPCSKETLIEAMITGFLKKKTKQKAKIPLTKTIELRHSFSTCFNFSATMCKYMNWNPSSACFLCLASTLSSSGPIQCMRLKWV